VLGTLNWLSRDMNDLPNVNVQYAHVIHSTSPYESCTFRDMRTRDMDGMKSLVKFNVFAQLFNYAIHKDSKFNLNVM
jgi:hypothetical protein